jgi:hypothetical protein
VLRRLVAESDPDTIEQFDFAAAAPVKAWPDRSVTLLGDAIHFPAVRRGRAAAPRRLQRLTMPGRVDILGPALVRYPA